MTIHLKPEIEQLIHQDVQRGPYQTADEFVERAVQMLHEPEEWLSANRAKISAKIDKGYQAAQRGELTDAEQVRKPMAEKKRVWLTGPNGPA